MCNDNKQTPCAVLLPRANIQRDEHKETSLRTIYVLQLQVFPVRLSYHTTTITSISVVSDKNQENKHPQVSIENQASDRSSSLNLPPNRRGEMRDVFAIPISCPYMYLFLILRGTYAHTHTRSAPTATTSMNTTTSSQECRNCITLHYMHTYLLFVCCETREKTTFQRQAPRRSSPMILVGPFPAFVQNSHTHTI